MPNTSFADVVTEWEKLLTAVTANQADLQHLEVYRAELEVELGKAKIANSRQSALQAEVQQMTRDVEAAIATGRDLATRIRTGVRSKYGGRSEKLTEFGLRPFRKRVRVLKVKSAQPVPIPPPQS